MTNPTNLRASIETLASSVANLAADVRNTERQYGPREGAEHLRSVAGLIRDLLSALLPACDCDGGLFGAGPGDHAIGCPARPPEAPGERRPVAGWVDEGRGSRWSLALGLATARVYVYRDSSVWRLHDRQEWQPVDGDTDGTAARIAAEDAAADLMRAGLAALGRKP